MKSLVPGTPINQIYIQGTENSVLKLVVEMWFFWLILFVCLFLCGFGWLVGFGLFWVCFSPSLAKNSMGICLVIFFQI